MDSKNDEMSPHRKEACKRLSPIGQKLFKYVEFDDDEELIGEIRRHPIGLFFIVVSGVLISAVIFLSTLILALNLDNLGLGVGESGTGSAKAIIILVGAIVGLLAVIATTITAILYNSNVVYITNEKIADVMYVSLFNRKITQLGVGQVEDVTVSQKGILPRVFDYGTIIVETAGEIKNPSYVFVPKPNKYSQIIIKIHEEYVEKYGN